MVKSLKKKVSQMRLSGKGMQSKVLSRRLTAYFHCLKGYTGCLEKQGLQRGKKGVLKLV